MKKVFVTGLCMLMTAAILGGCSKNDTKNVGEDGKETETGVNIDSMKEPELEDLKITLGNYKNVEVTIEAMSDITDEEVENQLNSLVSNGTTQTEVTDRAVADGDLVKVDYEGYMDNQAISGESESDYNILIGSGVFFDGSEKQLIGVMPGETAEISVTYPDGYPNEALAGKSAVYKVTVKAILEEGRAELNDDYVKELSGGECSNVGEFRAYLKENLQKGVDAQKELLAQQAVWDKVIADTTIENYPEDLLKAKEEAYKKNDEESAKLENMTLEEYVEAYMGVSIEDYNQQIADEIEKSAKKSVISRAVAKQEGIAIDKLSDEDLKEAAEWFGYTDISQLKEYYSEDDIKAELMLKRVTELMMETAKVTEKAGE